MKLKLNGRTLRVVVIVILFSLIVYYKVAIDQVTQDFFGDREKPLTAYYIQEGKDYIFAEGMYIQENDTLQLGGTNGGEATWEFTIKILDWVDPQTKNSFIKTLYISTGSPYSFVKGQYVKIFINDYIITKVALTVPMSVSNQMVYTWNLPIGDLRVFHDPFWEKNMVKWNISQDLYYKTNVKISVDRSVTWSIKKIIVGLYSDPNTIEAPWWQKNFFLIVMIICGTFIGLIVLIKSIRRYLH